MHALLNGLFSFKITDPLIKCGKWRDSMPATRELAPYKLYYSARKLWRSKPEWTLSKDETIKILADVRLAAAQGDWGAKALLAYFLRVGFGPMPTNAVLAPDLDQAVAIMREAVAAGQAWGYYDLGVAYENAYGNVPYDREIAWAYYRQAAILGSPDAQVVLAEAYYAARNMDAANYMYRCAYEQGFGKAAYWFGQSAEMQGDWQEAIMFYQAGVKFGYADSASTLSLMFSDDNVSGYRGATRKAQSEIGIVTDIDRARRYRTIFDALEIDQDLRLPNLGKH